MGLIYVNPEGPNGNPDPLASARDIRETFARMAMNDEETVALIAGGHTFGKAHGAGDPPSTSARSRKARASRSRASAGRTASAAARAATPSPAASKAPGPPNPIKWDNGYFETLFGYEWELTKSPAGAHQWKPKDDAGATTVPDAHDPTKRHAPMMTTADMAMRMDPAYEKISRRFMANPQEFADAFARAWFKLTHRDMGPRVALPRPARAEGRADLAGPGPRGGPSADRRAGHRGAEGEDPRVGLVDFAAGHRPPGHRRRPSAAATSAAAPMARASASRRRRTGKSTSRPSWRRCWRRSKAIQKDFNAAQSGGKKVSLADLIVLGGCAAVEAAAKKAGHDVKVPFTPGRTDASQEQTDAHSFAPLEPMADGFRNYVRKGQEGSVAETAGRQGAPADADRARDDGADRRPARAGRERRAGPARRVHQAPRDADQRLLREPARHGHDSGRSPRPTRPCSKAATATTGELKWTGTVVDLVFGSNSQLRALAEVYAASDAQQKFVSDFVAAWNKVMNLDRFDLA